MLAVPHFLSPAEYLEIEQRSQIRHEYRRGLVYAMGGGTDNHDRIIFNLLWAIDRHLGESTDCRFCSGNVKINYQDQFYYYPDACDPCDRSDRYIKRHPKLIAEVLSPNTQVFDTTENFQDCQNLASLEEYVLISQAEPRVECRITPQLWETVVYGATASVSLASLGLVVPIAELYRGIDG